MLKLSLVLAAALAATSGGEATVALRRDPQGAATLALAAPRSVSTVVELDTESVRGAPVATVVIPAGVARLAVATTGGFEPAIRGLHDLDSASTARIRVDAGPSPIWQAATPTPGDCQPSWAVMGGTSQRNGRSSETGPPAVIPLWAGAAPSQIAWLPVISGHRVFLVGQLGFPPDGEPNGSPIYAHDLDSGDQLWRADLPYAPGDWTTWVAAAANGRVYASRAGNGSTVAAPLYALDAATGKTLWVSAETITAGPYDGVVLAPNGDLIIGSFTDLTRIRAVDGTTVWRSPRQCCVSSSCGAVVNGDTVYIADAVNEQTGFCGGGEALVAFDLATGQRRHRSPTMPGATNQDMPFLGLDGTVYLARTQHNVATDFLYAWRDTGSEFALRWKQPAAWATTTVHAVGPDGSIYAPEPGPRLGRLDPASGSELAGVDGDFGHPRMAVDRDGELWVANGQFETGRLYAFSRDLAPRWDLAVPNINIGGPSIGPGGTLVVASTGPGASAYRAPTIGPGCFFADDLEAGEPAAWSSVVPAE